MNNILFKNRNVKMFGFAEFKKKTSMKEDDIRNINDDEWYKSKEKTSERYVAREPDTPTNSSGGKRDRTKTQWFRTQKSV